DLRVAWLLEPIRSKRVHKYSGTNKHPNHQDLLGQTMSAFAHFSCFWSKGTMVFADLQSTTTATIKGGSLAPAIEHVLFDPMTHTLSQDSGIGDHGRQGILDFLQQHTCQDMCKSLALDKVSITLADEE
ncbi:kinase-like protein, partial [Panus rudis PR-1116 ss-1]